MGVLWMLCTVWTVPSSQVKCRTCPGRNWNWRPLNSKAVSLTLESQHGTRFAVWNFWVSAFHILKFILHSVSISLQHRNFAIQYRKQKLIYMSIAWIIWIVWLPRGNPWSGKTPKASELFPVAIPQSSCQAESDNKIMVSTHHPLPWGSHNRANETQAQKPQKSQKFPTSKKIVSKCPGIPWENERFHRPRKGRQHRQRIWDLRLCFGTWHFRATQCWQPKFVPKIENVNPGTPSKTGSTRNINSSQCDIHVRLVSWIHSPGSTRETTLGEIPQKCAPWTPRTWSKRTENVWCHFCIQCLNPFTLPLNLPHLTNIELSWIILDYW